MSWSGVAGSLRKGLQEECADDIEEGLCNLSDGTCDALELIPLLEQVANSRFWFFDDNGAGGFPHPTGNPVGFAWNARQAIHNIRENARLVSTSAAARLLKSADTADVENALEQLSRGAETDETLFPILEKITRKDAYDAYAYAGGRSTTHRLGQAARNAIRRIRENRTAGGLPVNVCSVCDSIPDVAKANTGRDEYFGPPVTSLKGLGLGEGEDDDLRECPECGALFVWRDERSFTGSGNNDEQTLTRLFSIHSATLREILAGKPAAEDPDVLVERLLMLPRPAQNFAAILLRQRDRRALALQLLPALVEAAARDESWPFIFLKEFASAPEEARLLIGALDARPPASALAELRKHARVVNCSICSPVGTYPQLKLRRNAPPANLPALKQLGASERNDVWDCPECASLFHWTSEDGVDGGLARIARKLAEALRKCIDKSGADEGAIETVFACGREWQEFLFAYAMRHDPNLVIGMVPRMVSSLARYPEPWMQQALSAVARDPLGASAVRTALPPTKERTNPLIKALAKEVRQPKAT